jgi:Kef-type K+ transport system membrane component KefB
MELLLTLTDKIFIASVAILLLPYLFSLLLPRKYFPLAVLQICCGILFGPALLGHFYPHFQETLFSKEAVSALGGLAIISVVFFSAGIGNELELKIEHTKLWKQILLTTFIPGIIGWFTAPYMLQFFDLGMVNDWKWQMTVALALSIAAIPIMGVILRQLGITNTKLGQDILAMALVTDCIVWIALTIFLWVLNFAHIHWAWGLVYVLIQITLGRKLLDWMENKPHSELFLLVYILLSGGLAHYVGIHYIFGGFLAGVVIPKSFYKKAIEPHYNTISILLVPFFFHFTGLKTTFSLDGYAIFGMALLWLFIGGITKFLGMYIVGNSIKDSWASGWILQTKGLMDIVIANILLEHGVINQQVFATLIIYAIFSTLITTPLVNHFVNK